MTALPDGFPEPTEVGVIEVKQYPQYRAVTYTHTGSLERATGVAFDPLFQHISSNQIEMTTPVEARYLSESPTPNPASGQAEVSFLYPSTKIEPQKVAADVTVGDRVSMLVISIGLQGPYSWESYQQNLQKLQDWLADHPEYEVVGSPRRLFYNSPMTPESLKRSEVQIPVQKT